jgi:hypothetical protein
MTGKPRPGLSGLYETTPQAGLSSESRKWRPNEKAEVKSNKAIVFFSF